MLSKVDIRLSDILQLHHNILRHKNGNHIPRVRNHPLTRPCDTPAGTWVLLPRAFKIPRQRDIRAVLVFVHGVAQAQTVGKAALHRRRQVFFVGCVDVGAAENVVAGVGRVAYVLDFGVICIGT